jgi:hypothetical protein
MTHPTVKTETPKDPATMRVEPSQAMGVTIGIHPRYQIWIISGGEGKPGLRDLRT